MLGSGGRVVWWDLGLESGCSGIGVWWIIVQFFTLQVESLFQLLSPLVKDQPDQPSGQVRRGWGCLVGGGGGGGGGGKVVCSFVDRVVTSVSLVNTHHTLKHSSPSTSELTRAVVLSDSFKGCLHP